MDPRRPTILPPASLSVSEAVLLLAYLSIRTVLQLQPENYQFVNPVVLLEMSRLSLLIRSKELLQVVNVGLMETGGFNACFVPTLAISPTMDSINHALDLLMNEDNRKSTPSPFSPTYYPLIDFHNVISTHYYSKMIFLLSFPLFRLPWMGHFSLMRTQTQTVLPNCALLARTRDLTFLGKGCPSSSMMLPLPEV
jgi:hypothetical protein